MWHRLPDQGGNDMKIDGACHCGAIAFEAELDPARVGICHCSDCQSLSASAFRTLALVDGETFTVLQGSPKDYVKVGDSGNRRVQAFCETCGSAIYSTSEGDGPKAYNIRLGIVRQRHELPPQFECWTGSACSWVRLQPDTKKFTGNPVL